MEHTLSKEEPKFDYNIILVDSDKKEECSSLFQDHEDIIIETLPSFQRESLPNYFSQKKEEAAKANKRILLITSQQSTLYFANEASMDTCFINNGINDFVSFSTTYEVPNVKQLKRFHK